MAEWALASSVALPGADLMRQGLGSLNMINFGEYVAYVQGRQRDYINEERLRYRRLDVMRQEFCPGGCARGREPAAYKRAAFTLQLHAQQADEIADRLSELDEMEREIPVSHGYTPTIHWWFECFVRSVTTPGGTALSTVRV